MNLSRREWRRINAASVHTASRYANQSRYETKKFQTEKSLRKTTQVHDDIIKAKRFLATDAHDQCK